MPCTPSVFCAVRAVMALVPYTPSAANVFKSACTPAPPPESDPAMVSARGGGLGMLVSPAVHVHLSAADHVDDVDHVAIGQAHAGEGGAVQYLAVPGHGEEPRAQIQAVQQVGHGAAFGQRDGLAVHVYGEHGGAS